MNTCFDRYDTEKLKGARKILSTVYEQNFDNSRKIMLLNTVIAKLGKIILEFGEENKK